MRDMANIFVTSDTHLCHDNIIKFTDADGNRIRPFNNVWEMNETILQHWNTVVKPNDIVWHLGDVFIGNRKSAGAILSKLNGKKFLIVGNHDRLNGKEFLTLKEHFQEIHFWQVWKKEKLILSHVPLREDTFKQKGKGGYINVFGHIHQNPPPKGPYVNVSVERTNYTPISIEDIKDFYEKTQTATYG